MKHYMLDTNIVSHLIKSHANVVKHVVAIPMTSLCISAITEGELLFGLAKRPEAKQLHRVVHELLLRIEVLPWNSTIAKTYGTLRSSIEAKGNLLAPLDLLIAAHALSTNTTLVINGQAFIRVRGLLIEDWTK